MSNAIDDAVTWLRDLLAGGPKSATDVRAQAGGAGLSWPVIRRAQDRLGIKPTRQSEGAEGAGKWLWALPIEQAAHLAPPDLSSMDEKSNEQAAHVAPIATPQAQDARDVSAPRPKRVVTVRRRGEPANGPNELSWAEFESLECARSRVPEYVRRRDLQEATANAEI
jgi:hypothetical protein